MKLNRFSVLASVANFLVCVYGAATETNALQEAELRQRRPRPGGRWTNSLGMAFAPVPGIKVLFCIWDSRVKDYAAYAVTNSHVNTDWKNPGFEQGEDHPVVMVSWWDAKAFCEWLTRLDQAAGLLDRDQQYRLPTDEEWSVAVGLPGESGNTPWAKNSEIRDVYPWGTQWPPPRGAGNYGQNLGVDDFEYTSPVGSFKANCFGLFDMGGNVWQWCEDGYYPMRDFLGYRVWRGASWLYDYTGRLPSSHRGRGSSGARISYCGFRVVLELDGSARPAPQRRPPSQSEYEFSVPPPKFPPFRNAQPKI